MSIEKQDDLGFVHEVTKSEHVLIHHNGQLAATLRGAKAAAFIKKMNSLTFSKQQQLMARVTGNYKRGNERFSKNHPRNRF